MQRSRCYEQRLPSLRRRPQKIRKGGTPHDRVHLLGGYAHHRVHQVFLGAPADEVAFPKPRRDEGLGGVSF